MASRGATSSCACAAHSCSTKLLSRCRKGCAYPGCRVSVRAQARAEARVRPRPHPNQGAHAPSRDDLSRLRPSEWSGRTDSPCPMASRICPTVTRPCCDERKSAASSSDAPGQRLATWSAAKTGARSSAAGVVLENLSPLSSGSGSDAGAGGGGGAGPAMASQRHRRPPGEAGLS